MDKRLCSYRKNTWVMRETNNSGYSGDENKDSRAAFGDVILILSYSTYPYMNGERQSVTDIHDYIAYNIAILFS